MGENRPSALYIMILLASGIMIGTAAFQAELLGNYGVDSPDVSYLNRTREIVDETETLKDTIEDFKLTGIDVLDLFIAGVYNALKSVFTMGDIFTSLLSDIADELGLPGWFIGILVAAVFSVIIWGIISIITKWRA